MAASMGQFCNTRVGCSKVTNHDHHIQTLSLSPFRPHCYLTRRQRQSIGEIDAAGGGKRAATWEFLDDSYLLLPHPRQSRHSRRHVLHRPSIASSSHSALRSTKGMAVSFFLFC